MRGIRFYPSIVSDEEECFTVPSVIVEWRVECEVESDRSFPNEFMSYPKANIHFFGGMYYIVQEGHTVLESKMQQHHVQQKCTTPKPFVFPRPKKP